MQSGILVFIVFAVLTLVAGGRSAGHAGRRISGRKNPGNSQGASGWRESAASFFLDNRTLGAFALFLTTAATNFSAFTVLGLSGAGYRMGYVFYPVMAAGTGFMAIGMYLVGLPMIRHGRRLGWITPVDCVADRYGSPALTKLYALSLVIFTIPYLALQPMAAGMLLESAMGIPYRLGVVSVALIICIYTVAGGMRAVVRTDVFHGILFFGLALGAWLVLLSFLGGFDVAHSQAFAARPWLFARPGGSAGALKSGAGSGVGAVGASEGLSFLAWAGYFVMWFLADPVFPQLGQRFLAARDEKALRRTVVAYPLVTATLFFFTVSFGVLSTLVIPDLSAKASDRIWPLVVARLNGPILSPILLLAPIAALMTTMDSQLLTLSSIVVRDLAGYRRESSAAPRLAVILLTLAGTAIALSPPSDIIAFLNRTSFSGYAALAPVVFCGFYGKKTGSATALAGMLAGEAMVVALGFGWVGFPGIPEIFPVAGIGWTVFGIGYVFRSSQGSKESRFTPSRLTQTLSPLWILAFLLVLVPVMDFWNWNRELVPVFGLPDWVWRSIGSCLALSGMLALFFRTRATEPGSSGEPSRSEELRSSEKSSCSKDAQ